MTLKILNEIFWVQPLGGAVFCGRTYVLSRNHSVVPLILLKVDLFDSTEKKISHDSNFQTSKTFFWFFREIFFESRFFTREFLLKAAYIFIKPKLTQNLTPTHNIATLPSSIDE